MRKLKVFIDGIYGTTGLEIDKCLMSHSGVEILRIPEAQKKDQNLRDEYAGGADAVILCLHDEEALIAVRNYQKHDHLKIFDTSTAHRTHADWVYGLAELSENSRNKIKGAQFIANSGCYPVGVCLTLYPLVENNLLDDHEYVVVTGISGFSGGGRTCIETYQTFSAHQETAKNSFRTYSLGKVHKHIPEMQLHSGYTGRIHFTPSVAFTHQGMMIQTHLNKSAHEAETIADILRQRYADERYIQFHGLNNTGILTDGFMNMTGNNGTNDVDMACFHAGHQLTVICYYDNLGKGASLNVIQNFNLAFGFMESEGIPHLPIDSV